MINNKIGMTGYVIVTNFNSSVLIAAYINDPTTKYATLATLREHVFRDNEGETFFNRRVWVNIIDPYVDGNTDLQANIVANTSGNPNAEDLSEALWVKPDNSGLEYKVTGLLGIKALGVQTGMINLNALEAGLDLIGGKVGVKLTGTTLELFGGGVRVRALGITPAELAALSVTAAKLNADTKGAGIVPGGGTAVAVSVAGTTVTISANNLEVTNASISGVKIVPNSLGVNEFADHVKYFTIPIELDGVDQGANNDIKINKNFTILGVTGIITETLAVTGAGNLTIEMIVNGFSEITHSIPDGTVLDTTVTFGAFTTIPLDCVASDFTTVFNLLQFVLGNTGVGVTAGKVRLDIHCITTP